MVSTRPLAIDGPPALATDGARASAVLAGSASAADRRRSHGRRAERARRRRLRWRRTAAPFPAALTDPRLGLRAGPVAVPLALGVALARRHASVLGVGITPKNVMDAPTGPPATRCGSRRSGIAAARSRARQHGAHRRPHRRPRGRPGRLRPPRRAAARRPDRRPRHPHGTRDPLRGHRVEDLSARRSRASRAVLTRIYGAGPGRRHAAPALGRRPRPPDAHHLCRDVPERHPRPPPRRLRGPVN